MTESIYKVDHLLLHFKVTIWALPAAPLRGVLTNRDCSFYFKVDYPVALYRCVLDFPLCTLGFA